MLQRHHCYYMNMLHMHAESVPILSPYDKQSYHNSMLTDVIGLDGIIPITLADLLFIMLCIDQCLSRIAFTAA